MNRDWDPRLTQRGVTLQDAPGGGEWYWRIAEARYLGTEGGKHHIFFDVVNENGVPLVAVPIIINNGGEARVITKLRGDNEPAADFPMFASGWGYSARVADQPSESIHGMGLGTIEAPHMGHHVSYYVKFQRTRRGGTLPGGPVEPPVPGQYADMIRHIQAARVELDKLERLIQEARGQ